MQFLAVLRQADIVVDQILFGDYGLLSVEAMALGKPVVCYLRDSVVQQHPSECPIVNANPDNLAQVLADLLADGKRRYELGRRGRAYVEKYHDAHKIALQLVSIYEELLAKKQRERRGGR